MLSKIKNRYYLPFLFMCQNIQNFVISTKTLINCVMGKFPHSITFTVSLPDLLFSYYSYFIVLGKFFHNFQTKQSRLMVSLRVCRTYFLPLNWETNYTEIVKVNCCENNMFYRMHILLRKSCYSIRIKSEILWFQIFCGLKILWF